MARTKANEMRNKKSKQKSVKEMLSEKSKITSSPASSSSTSTSNNIPTEETVDSFVLPVIFDRYVDITKPSDPSKAHSEPSFSCSSTARVYFRDNSNFNEVLKNYLETIKNNERPISAYTSTVIRCVMSSRRRWQYPFDQFRFKSRAHDVVARTILMHPLIGDQQHIEDFFKFQKTVGLKLCSVDMRMNNPTATDGLDYVRDLQAKHKTNGDVPIPMRNYKDSLIRRHHEREGTIKNFFLRDVNVEILEGISNFKKFVKKYMEEEKEDPEDYKKNAKAMLRSFKKGIEPSEIIEHPLIFKPHVNFITNVMTNEEQDEVANDIDKFRNKTSAWSIHKPLRRKMTWSDFYALYKSRNNFGRKLPPFHNLKYTGERTTPAPSTSSQGAVVTPLEFKTTQRFVNADKSRSVVVPTVEDSPEAVAVEIVEMQIEKEGISKELEPKVCQSNSSEKLPRQTVDEAITADSIENDLREMMLFLPIPNYLLKNPNPNEESGPFVKVVARDKNFIINVRNFLNHQYAYNFTETWKEHKKAILSNFISECWQKDLVKLGEFLDGCEPTVAIRALELIEAKKKLNEDETSNSVEWAEEDDDVEEMADLATFAVVPQGTEMCDIDPQVGEVLVKHERRSFLQEQRSCSVNSDSSDIVYLGTFENEEIVIDDSENLDDSLIRTLEARDGNPNPFLREISEGTQPETEANQLSDETLKRVRQYIPYSVHQHREDQDNGNSALKETTNKQQVATPSKRKASTLGAPCPKSKKHKLTPGKLNYVDEDSESLDGNKFQLNLVDQALNHDFIFLSSELMDVEKIVEKCDEKATVSEENPFSFTRTPGSDHAVPGATSFVANLVRVVFEKNVKFELFLSLPVFNLFSILVSEENIREVLDISDYEFISLTNLLNVLNKYEFTVGRKRTRQECNQEDGFIVRQLDLFFNHDVKFKTFQVHSGDDNFSFTGGSFASSINIDLSSSVLPEVLDQLI